MKHLFVPYEIALMAKENGFDEICLFFYYPITDNYSEYELFFTTDDLSEDLLSCGSFASNSETNRVCAPLYQQLIDWFREKHDFWISVEFGSEYIPLYVFGYHGSPRRTVSSFGVNYYECLNYAIKEAFKLI